MTPQRLPAWTSVRGFAALYVVLFHGWSTAAELHPALPSVISHGYVGVNIFFVLSGLVLTHVEIDENDALRKTRRQFYVARIARLFPLYVLAWLWCTPYPLRLALAPDPTVSLGRLVTEGAMSLFALNAFWPPYSLAWNFPAWSLGAELLFYATFPFVVPRLARATASWSAVRLGAGVLAATAWAMLLPALDWHLDGRSEFVRAFVKHHPLSHIGEFLVGVLGALAMRKLASHPRRRALERAGLAAGALYVALLLSLPASLHIFIHNGLLMPLVCAALVAAASHDRIAQIAAWRPLLALGEASYAIYLLHFPFALTFGFVTHWPVSGSNAAFATYVASLVAISWVVFRFVETPARKRLMHFAERGGWILKPLGDARPCSPARDPL